MLHSISLHVNNTIDWLAKFPSHPEFPKTIKCVVAGALLGVAISFATGTYLPITFTAGVVAGFLVDRLTKGLSVWMEERARAHNEEVNRCMDEIEDPVIKSIKGATFTNEKVGTPQYSYDAFFAHFDGVHTVVFTVKKQTIHKKEGSYGRSIELPGRVTTYRHGIQVLRVNLN